MKTAKRAAVYARISSDREELDEDAAAPSSAAERKRKAEKGVTRQRKACLALVESKGWELVDTYVDNSISAYSGKLRPEYERLLDDVKNGQVDVIVAWASDRLTRQLREFADLVELMQTTGCLIETVTTGTLDLSDPTALMTAQVLSAIATKESHQRSVRMKAKLAEKRANGETHGGQHPYGWTKGRKELVPHEVAHIRDWYQRIIDGDSVSAIVRDLNKAGVKTRNGGAWERQTIRNILKSPSTAGLMHYRGEIQGEGKWPAAVDRKTWETANAILADPRRKTTYRNTMLLTGLIEDPHGRKLKSHPQARRSAYGVLNDDKHPGVYAPADVVDPFVVDAVFEWTDGKHLPDVDLTTSSAAKLEALEAEMVELVRLRENDEIRLSEFVPLSKSLRAKIDEERSLLPDMVDLRWQQPGALRREWENMSITQQKSALRETLDKVVIRSYQSGDTTTDRIEVLFKH